MLLSRLEIRVMKTKNFFTIITLLLATQLVGCCSTKDEVAIVTHDQDLRAAGTRLTAAAESVSKSLQELAKIDRAVNPQIKLSAPDDPDRIGMGQISSIDWSGPVGPIVKKIADAAHYNLKVLGSPPAVPILISVTAKDTPLADVLRNIEFQCGRRANIVVYASLNIIELRYVKA